MIKLYQYQEEALEKLKSGSILCGGVGSGKSITGLAWYWNTNLKKDLYIITTAKKRDTLEWDKECLAFGLSKHTECSIFGIKVVIDSWNNIKKYQKVTNSCFLFDEQRLVGSGTWVKTFLKLAQRNQWLLLSATPGDNWMDYIPVFVANRFYKNRTEFLREHAVYSRFSKYPKIEKFIGEPHLQRLRDSITVTMNHDKLKVKIHKDIIVDYDEQLLKDTMGRRWNIYKDKPIRNISEFCYVIRKIVNSDSSRLLVVKEIVDRHRKVVLFYNFNYELESIIKYLETHNIPFSQWNGHKHEPIPKTDSWVYLVQYLSGAEGWNCTETDTILFFSQNYSYRITHQAAGRIDRINSPFHILYYYHILSKSKIDKAIKKALKLKQTFNQSAFAGFFDSKFEHTL